MGMTNIAILVSGSGSNMTAVIEAVGRGEIPARVVLVVSSNKEAGAIEKARARGIPAIVCALADYGSREERDAAIIKALREHNAGLVVLAGYLGILTPQLIKEFRIINIHPSLLPKHGGAGMYGIKVHESIIAAGDAVAGATVHFVTEEIDGGDIVMQRSCKVLPDDTAESLQKRVLETIEHKLLIDAIKKVIEER